MTIEERLEKLELRVSELEGKLAGADVAPEVRAERFVLIDENGEARAYLGFGLEGPGLTLIDDKGETGTYLAVQGLSLLEMLGF